MNVVRRSARCFLFGAALAAVGFAAPQESAPTESRPASRPGPTVTILAVDSEGNPQQGIPIRVLGRAGTTDQAGIVRLERPGADRPARSGTKAVVRFDFPTAAEAARIDLPHLDDRPIRVVVPPTGRVLVRLLDPEGRPYRRETRVRLLIEKPGSADESGSVEAVAQGGEASFPLVATGLSFEIRIHMADGMRTARAWFTGPKNPGEQVVADIACGLSAAVMKGRLLSEDGSPVAGATLAVEPEYWRSYAETRSSAVAWTLTEADGRFRATLDIDPAALSGMTIGLRRLFLVTKGTPYRPGQRIGSVQLPSKDFTGEIDLGDVRIDQGPVIVAGTVVDSSGAPLHHAQIRVERFDRGRWSPLRDDDDDGWVEGYSGTDGRFEVRGLRGGASLRAGARTLGWFLAEAIPFKAGERDLRIVMARAGDLEGSIAPLQVGGEPLDRGSFRVLLCGEPTRSDSLYNKRTDGIDLFLFGGRFMGTELRPGLATLKLRFDGDPEPFLTVENVEIKPGETNRDPRLQEIDLAKLVRQLRITVRDEAGTPIANAEVSAHPAGSASDSWVMFRGDRAGQVVVLSRTPAAEIVVRAEGYRSSKIASVEADLAVKLTRAAPITVTVVLDPGADLLEPPMQLGCALAYVRGLDEPQPESMPSHHPIAGAYRTTPFGADRTATIAVGDPGVYRVELWAHTRSANGSGGRSLDSFADFVTVTGKSRELEVHVRVSAEDVARYVENRRSK